MLKVYTVFESEEQLEICSWKLRVRNWDFLMNICICTSLTNIKQEHVKIYYCVSINKY